MDTGSQIIREIGLIADNKAAMGKLLKYVKKLVKDFSDSETISKEEELERLRTSLLEVKAAEKGEIKLRPLK